MANFGEVHYLALKAGADLSTKQFLFMKMSADMTCTTNDAGTNASIGVLADKPYAATGVAVSVATIGVFKVYAGGTVTAGNLVGSDTAGKAVALTPGTDTTKYICGTALTGGAANEIITVLLNCASPTRAA